MPDGAESIAGAIAEAEERAGSAQDAAPDFETRVAIWFAMEERTARLRDLMRLREPGMDEDCKLAGCGNYGRSII